MKKSNEEAEKYRVRSGPFRSKPEDGNNGVFMLPNPFMGGWTMRCIVSDGAGWEHVSVSLVPPGYVKHAKKRLANWNEMCHVKDMFWEEEETAVQFHPPRSEYVNTHPYVLHLWRPVDGELPRPPAILVGLPGVELGG